MRTEREMIRLITDVAERDPCIRAAYMEGSRANPNAPKDIFQDYDIVYIVTETKRYREDRTWIDRFGERLYMQYPEEGAEYAADVENCYGWLMQFADGNRLDLHVCTRERALKNLALYKTLLDKDGIMPADQMTCDRQYWVREPDKEQFHFACNEFWWCLNNVAKGLWRGEIPYVMDMVNDHVRPMLTRLLSWKIGAAHQFSVSVGKSAKYMEKYLSEEIYQRYLMTYPAAELDAIWKSVFIMCDLFEETAGGLSERFGFFYDRVEAEHSRSFLEHVRELPPDAEEIY